MSSAFRVAGESFTGTNGAIELYIEALAKQATQRFGAHSPIAEFFRAQQALFPLMGALIVLDDVLCTPARGEQFIEALDLATEELLAADAFSEYGVSWVNSIVSQLRAQVLRHARDRC